MMKLAILGSGGREHALAWKFAQSLPQADIFVLPGNGGIPNSIPIDCMDFSEIRQFCRERDIRLIFVGPEAPLVAGIADFFAESGIKVFGPVKQAALLEGSKIFAKQFMAKYGVATADFRVFEEDSPTAAHDCIRKFGGDVVMKYDGLAAGKGVYVCSGEDEALTALQDLHTQYGAEARFLIEKKLHGAEISIIGFTDGQDIRMLMPSQDHKQLYDGDTGPNTGGMGAYCPPTFYNDALMASMMDTIVTPTLKGLQGERLDFTGVIYFGIMLTDEGPQLLEYNVRLGDPETEVILPAMKSDLLQLVLACFDGTLADYRMEYHDGYFVDVVLASGGYPKNYTKGYEIQGLESVSAGTLIFHAGTALKDGKIITSGGRVLNVASHGSDLAGTINKVYQECRKIHFTDIYYRTDIAKRDVS